MPDFIVQAFDEMAISPILMILSVVIIAPIYEEVIFRGIMLKGMASKMNPILAIIISSLFFAILHMNIPQGINAFLLGIVIGSIYLNTGSIYLSIFAHFVNNSVGITISGLYGINKWKVQHIISWSSFHFRNYNFNCQRVGGINKVKL